MESDRPLAATFSRYRFAAMLRGGSRPMNLALAVMFGLALGFTAGWNFTFLALAALAALANVNSKLLAASALSGAVVAWLASPVTSGIGTFVFSETRLGSWIAVLGDGPLVAMFDLDSYCLMGGLVLAFALAGPLGRAAWQFGESRRPEEVASAGRRREGLLRPCAWLALPLVALLAGAIPWWIGTRQLERRVLALLSDFNGAEVSATRVHLDPWTGRLELDALEIPDPANLERDRLRIAHVRARLRGGPLLRGRLEIEHLQLSGIDRDVARRKAATAVTARIPQIRFSPAPLTLPTDASQELELHDYIRGWDQFASRLAHLGQLLGELERFRSIEPDHLERASAATLFGRGQRSNLGRPQPALTIEHAVAEGFGESWGLGPRSLVELRQLSTNPKLAKTLPSLRIALPELTAEIKCTVDFVKPGQRHRVQLQVGDLPLALLVEQSSGGSRIVVEDGRVTIFGEGWMDDSRFDLALQMQITDLDARLQGSEPAAGITPAAWNRGLKNLGGLRAELTCNGRWASPRLHVQARDLVSQFKHQLRSAGDHELLSQIDEQQAAPVPLVPTVAATDAVPSPVELPHPLPDPAPAAVSMPAIEPRASTPIAPPLAPLQPSTAAFEATPQPTSVGSEALTAPGANVSPAGLSAAPLVAETLVAAYPRTDAPVAAPTVAGDAAAPVAQPIEQPRNALAEMAPVAGLNPLRAAPISTPPVPTSSGIVQVSDDLFGPPPLAVPAAPQRPLADQSAVQPAWKPPAQSNVPSYRSPARPSFTYVSPASPATQTYSPPPAVVAPATRAYTAPLATADPFTSYATLTPSPPSSASQSMPGPINLQTGVDPLAPSPRPNSVPMKGLAQKPKRPRGPGIPTPKMTDMNDPLHAATFFYKSNKPVANQQPPADAGKTPDGSEATAKTAKLPWYKRLF